MTIVLWLTLGLTVGVASARLHRSERGSLPELAVGLAASVVGGVLALLFG